MNIILFGPQGCGKGTQADLITRNYGLYHLSTGNELRSEAKKSTPLGKTIKKIIDAGNLVPDDITNKILISAAKRHHSMILDGYPRRESQLIFLMKHMKIDAAIEIVLSEKESIKRISARRMCPKCKRNYNVIYIKPKVVGRCDIDGEKLIQRDDDKPAEIKKRLEIYMKDTEPLKRDYKKQKMLHVVDGNQPIEDVYKDVDKILKKIK